MKTGLVQGTFFFAVLMAATGLAPASDLSRQAIIPTDERQQAQDAADKFRAGDFNAAAAIYITMIQDHPDSLYAWCNLGVARFQQGKLDDARDALQHAADLNSKDAFARTTLGITEFQLGKYDDAVDNLEAAVVLAPNDPEAHNYLGKTYENLGRPEQARIEFDKARQLRAVASQ